jgi:hypothetical protein
MEIYYFMDTKKHAFRRRPMPPRENEFVKLKTGVYKVFRVLWIDNVATENPDDFHVRVDLELISEK